MKNFIPASLFSLQSLAQQLWGWVKSRPAHWAGRFGSIKKMRVENFEIVDFFGMVLFFVYLNSSWFNGPYTQALHHAISNVVWCTLTGSIAALTLFGFLEEQFTLRRAGAIGCGLFFFSVGMASVHHYPHWIIGFVWVWCSVTPFWLFTQVAVLKIKEEKRSDIAPGVVIITSEDLEGTPVAVVRMPIRQG